MKAHQASHARRSALGSTSTVPLPSIHSLSAPGSVKPNAAVVCTSPKVILQLFYRHPGRSPRHVVGTASPLPCSKRPRHPPRDLDTSDIAGFKTTALRSTRLLWLWEDSQVCCRCLQRHPLLCGVTHTDCLAPGALAHSTPRLDSPAFATAKSLPSTAVTLARDRSHPRRCRPPHPYRPSPTAQPPSYTMVVATIKYVLEACQRAGSITDCISQVCRRRRRCRWEDMSPHQLHNQQVPLGIRSYRVRQLRCHCNVSLALEILQSETPSS